MKKEAWQMTGRLIDEIGTPDFPKALTELLRGLVPFDFVVMFGYVGANRPLHLFDNFPADRRRMHVEEYQEGPYLLDPFFLASTNLSEPGLWRLRELAPDRFYQGEYFRNYYAQTGLAEEVGYLIQINDALVAVVSLMRKERRFGTAEIRLLKEAWPVVSAACRQNWRDVAEEPASVELPMRDRIEHAFHSIGEGVLTPRERQVAEYTLRGHSAEAIGQQLGISAGTVRIHRRNIYSKLRINSQGELFSQFISSIVHSGARY